MNGPIQQEATNTKEGGSLKNPAEQSYDHCIQGTPEHGKDTGPVETKLMPPASGSNTRLVGMLIWNQELGWSEDVILTGTICNLELQVTEKLGKMFNVTAITPHQSWSDFLDQIMDIPYQIFFQIRSWIFPIRLFYGTTFFLEVNTFFRSDHGYSLQIRFSDFFKKWQIWPHGTHFGWNRWVLAAPPIFPNHTNYRIF